MQELLPEWQGFYVIEGEKVRLDMVGFTLKQLGLMGVPKANIEVGGLCTALHVDEFYSCYDHALERGRCGTLVGLRK